MDLRDIQERQQIINTNQEVDKKVKTLNFG